MYINKIDDLIDKIIDDFFVNVIKKNKTINNICGEPNFVKFQKEINGIFIDYIKTVNTDEIKQLGKIGDNIHHIMNIIKKYIGIYLFLYIGIFYKGKPDTYINNIVEFTKNQSNFQYKIENFFNSESNAGIIKTNNLISNILEIINAPQSSLNVLLKKPEFAQAVDLLNGLGEDYVKEAFRLSNKEDQAHNIIKTIIVLFIYKKTEKDSIMSILESIENETGEYIFIDVIIPKKQYINFGVIESMLTKKEIEDGMAHDIWAWMIEQDEQSKLADLSNEMKIMNLIDKKILVPIVDDFLLYHKDSERYDKTVDQTQIKKKEDTKIRYIVTKLDKVSDFNSDTAKSDPKALSDIKKLFYTPMFDRKAVLHNEIEEINIINKLINQGKQSVANNEYFNDLVHYKRYPYINFKDLPGPGFTLLLENTIDLVRAVTFNNKTRVTQELAHRVGSEGQFINIIGFMVPPSANPIQCLRFGKTTNVRELFKSGNTNKTNGYNLLLKYFQETKLNTKSSNTAPYWLFDATSDKAKMDTYEQFNKLNLQEQFKYIVGRLYDELTQEAFYELVDILSKTTDASLYNLLRLVEKFQKKTLSLTHREFTDVIEDKIYSEKIKKITPRYDETDDKFFGLTGEIVKLPKIQDKAPLKIQTVRIDIAQITKKEENVQEEAIVGMCQHNITWESVVRLRRSDPTSYTNALYSFVEKYVLENTEREYICKSCGFLLNIKKFISDGVFDDESDKFITFATSMDVPLEDIPEYEKYIPSIRIIDKLIEKISSISNMLLFTGSSSSVRWKRKGVTKDFIDLVLLHNSNLRKTIKERNTQVSKLYGISRELTNLFVFDLDNSIFVFTSKEKDYYKNIKHNNSIAYLLILMILELGNNQISFMYGDKKGVCNFPVFDKYGHILFEGLKIVKNKEGDTTEIKRYPILCYLLYLASCMITKYNLWFYESPSGSTEKVKVTKTKKFDPKIQKSVIHTTIDLLNSILETGPKNKNRLYEVVGTKFYKKMRETFANPGLLDMFRNNENKSNIVTNKEPIEKIIQNIPLTGKLIELIWDYPPYLKYLPTRYYVQTRKEKIITHYTASNKTTCPSGLFHEWVLNGKDIKCKLCNELGLDKYDEKSISKLNAQYKYTALNRLAHRYCADGVLGKYIRKYEKACDVPHDYTFGTPELDELEKSWIQTQNKTIEARLSKYSGREIKTSEYESSVLTKLDAHYKRDSSTFIDQFLGNIQGLLGELPNGKYNTYVIDHDHLGNPLDKPFVIPDTDGKIQRKAGHQFFKTDVIYYTNTRAGKIDVFYDGVSHILLGWKEQSKDYVLAKKTDKKIKINYSIGNKIKLLGFDSQYYKISQAIEQEIELIKSNSNVEIKYDKVKILKEQVEQIMRARIDNLKKIANGLLRFIWKIIIKDTKKQTTQTKAQTDRVEKLDKNGKPYVPELDPFSKLLEKYSKTLDNLSITDEKGAHQVLKHLKAVQSNLFCEPLGDKTLNISPDELLNAEQIWKYDRVGNMLTYYIITEIDKLIHFNAKKSTKITTGLFIIDFINWAFDLFNTDGLMDNFEIKKFVYTLKSSGYIDDIEDISGTTQGIYEEQVSDTDEVTEEELEAQYDLEEEAQAIDMDMDMDAALDYYPDIDGDVWGDAIEVRG